MLWTNWTNMRYCRESGFVANTCFFGFVLSRLTQTFRILLRFCADIWTKYWLLRPLLGLLQCCTVSMRKVSKLISFIFRFNALLPCPSLLPTLRSLKSSWTRGFASRLTTAVRLFLGFLAIYPLLSLWWVVTHWTQVEGIVQGFDAFLNLVIEGGVEVVKREDQVTFGQIVNIHFPKQALS